MTLQNKVPLDWAAMGSPLTWLFKLGLEMIGGLGVPSLCLSQATQRSYRAQESCQGAVCCTCRWIRLTALSRVTSGLFHK